MRGADFADIWRESNHAKVPAVRTTIDIDDALMRKAMRLSGLTTKKAVVEAALRLLIQTHSQRRIRRVANSSPPLA
jgi:Arc/MetJ family transcription regulator